MKGNQRLNRWSSSVTNFGVQVFSHAPVVVTGTRLIEAVFDVVEDASAVRALFNFKFAMLNR
jgi:hypothetical protein